MRRRRGAIGPARRVEAAALRSRLAHGVAGAFTINVAATAVAFLAHIVLARVLGAQSFGIYAYVSAWVAALSLLATLGFQAGLLRFAAAYRAHEQWGLLYGVVRYAERRVAVAGMVLAAAGAATVVTADRLSPELACTFLIGLATVPMLALSQLRSSELRAFGRVAAALAPNQLVRQLVILCGVGALGAGFAAAVHAPLAMAVMFAGTVLALAITSLMLHRVRPRAMPDADVDAEPAVWRRAALFILLMAGAQFVMLRADVLMLGWLANTTAAGIYTVAFRLAELVGFALTAVNIIFAPTISALYARGDRAALQALVTTTAWWTTVFALAIALPLFFLAGVFLHFFGEAFVVGAGALRILLIGQLINAATGSVGYLMTMTGHERQAAVIVGVVMVGSIALNATLIPAFGMQGAAAANTTTAIAWNLAMATFICKKLGIVPSILGRSG